MKITQSAVARRIASWRRASEIRRATEYLDNRLRQDVGLPPRDRSFHFGRSFIAAYFDI